MRVGRFPVHPILFAVYPILLLFGANIGEVTWSDVFLPLAVSVGVAIVLFGGLSVLLRDRERAAILTTALLIAYFSFGYVRDGLEPVGLRAGILLVAYGLAGVALGVLVLRRRTGWAGVSRALTALGAVLVVLSVVTVAGSTAGGLTGAGATSQPTDVGSATRRTDRDIYYIILDRYASEHVARAYYGVEDPFLYRRLPELGFTVTADSQANYPRTLHSMASSLNLAYLDTMIQGHSPDERQSQPFVELLQEHAVGRFLKEQGYTYVHLGSWWDPTETNRLADLNPRFEQGSDFQAVLADTTILPEITGRLQRLGLPLAGGPTDLYRRHYDAGRFDLDLLDDMAAVPGPKFVLIHMLLPHDPYVFNLDGTFVSPEERRSRGREEGYERQLDYTDRQIAAFLESITDVPADRQPIVVLQADEGPNPPRYDAEEGTYPWLEATPEEFDEKFGILNAFFLPGDEAPVPYPGISPVNAFRLVLGAYFGVDLPLLPDRHYVFRDRDHPYDLIDVTDRVQAALTTR